MKKVFFLGLMLLSYSFNLVAQQPGDIINPQFTPMYVFNFSGGIVLFEPRTHNFGLELRPECNTFLHSLTPFSDIAFDDPTVVGQGVPLDMFGAGNVFAIHTFPTPSYVLTTPGDFSGYGKTQKWHCIKFAYDNGSGFGSYIKYGYDAYDPDTEENPDAADDYEIAPYVVIRPSTDEVFDTFSDDMYGYSPYVSDGTNTAIWNVIGDTIIIYFI